MDQSLDEIIAERPSAPRPRGRMGNSARPRRNNYRDSQKPFRGDRADLDLDWVHDRYEDDRDTRSSRLSRQPRADRFESDYPAEDARGSKIRVSNVHYDLTQEDLEELFTRIGPIHTLSLLYDRAGRSEGVAFVTYKRLSDAQTAIREFDGANAKGQPIRLTLMPSAPPPRRRNPFDSAEMPKGSLFDRAEKPLDRDSRSLSPDAEGYGGRRGRRHNGGLAPPERIDRYVPGQRSPIRKGDSGRNRGRRGGREARDGNTTGARGSGRTKKTQEELDQEMEDYWGKANAATEAAEGTNGAAITEDASHAAQPSTAPVAGGVEDVDMIE